VTWVDSSRGGMSRRTDDRCACRIRKSALSLLMELRFVKGRPAPKGPTRKETFPATVGFHREFSIGFPRIKPERDGLRPGRREGKVAAAFGLDSRVAVAPFRDQELTSTTVRHP
jgi:hypothetical protein